MGGATSTPSARAACSGQYGSRRNRAPAGPSACPVAMISSAAALRNRRPRPSECPLPAESALRKAPESGPTESWHREPIRLRNNQSSPRSAFEFRGQFHGFIRGPAAIFPIAASGPIRSFSSHRAPAATVSKKAVRFRMTCRTHPSADSIAAKNSWARYPCAMNFEYRIRLPALTRRCGEPDDLRDLSFSSATGLIARETAPR
jgi:hypothetical protein